jgi:hypothetical protein
MEFFIAFVLVLVVAFGIALMSNRSKSIKEGTWLGTAGVKAKILWDRASHKERDLMLVANGIIEGTYHDGLLRQSWGELPPEVRLSLGRTIESIESEQKSNANQPLPPAQSASGGSALSAAVACHDRLPTFIGVLETVAKEHVGDQLPAQFLELFDRLEVISKRFPPPIVTITMTYFLDQVLRVVPEDPVAIDIRKSVELLARALTEAMREEGYQKADVAEKVGRLTEEFVEAAKVFDKNVFAFVVAVCVDKYAQFLADSGVPTK